MDPTPPSRPTPSLRTPTALAAAIVTVIVAAALLVGVLRAAQSPRAGPTPTAALPPEALQVTFVKAPSSVVVGKEATVRVRVTNAGTVAVPASPGEIVTVGCYFSADSQADVALTGGKRLPQTLEPGQSVEMTVPCTAWISAGPTFLVARVFANRPEGTGWQGAWISPPSTWRVKVQQPRP